MDFLETIGKQVKEFFSKMEKKQIIRLAALAVLILATCIVAVVIINHKEYVVLFSEMSESELAEVYSKLKEDGVDVKTQDNKLLVPEKEAEELRWNLTAQGYPKTGLNYDTYTNGTGFGSTDATQATMKQFERESNLATTIRTLDKVQDALVLLNIQQKSVFAVSASTQPSTASVTITLVDPAVPLTADEADSIRLLVTKAVENLAPENVTIIDTQMRSYRIIDEEELLDKELGLDAAVDHLALTQEVQRLLNKSINTLLDPIFGQVQVQSAVTLNFDRRQSQSVIFDAPIEGMETGIPISIKEISEAYNNGAAASGTPGLDENGGSPSYVEVTQNDDYYNKISYEANMEVNEVKTLIERAQGNIEELSMSVVIPLIEDVDDYSQDVRELVATAIGTDIENITVKRLPVYTPDTQAAADRYQQELEAERQAKTMQAAIIAGAVVIIVVLLLIALRTVLKALYPPAPVVVEAEEVDETEFDQEQELITGGAEYWSAEPGEEETARLLAEQAALEAETQMIPDEFYEDEQETIEPEEEEEEEIEIEIPFEETPLGKVHSFIQNNPEAAAQVLRNWLMEDYR